MIVFISDLHFVDGSIGNYGEDEGTGGAASAKEQNGPNVAPEAFKVLTDDLRAFVESYEINDMKLVLLGDTFDILRSSHWFDETVENFPWDDKLSPELGQQVEHVLAKVIEACKEQRKMLKKELLVVGEKRKFTPELVYVPGNHDRLVNLFGSSRALVRQALDLSDTAKPLASYSQEPFANYFEDANHGVLALHGHEYDPYNFEEMNKNAAMYGPADYASVPIGDPITTELISRITYEVQKRVDEGQTDLTPEEKKQLIANFRELGNVRPFFATVEWLLNQTRHDDRVKAIVEKAIDETIKKFEKLPFVEDWMKKHDSNWKFFDEADKLQGAFCILKNFNCMSLGWLLQKIYSLGVRLAIKDQNTEGAARIFKDLEQYRKYRFVVMGHTHKPLQAPLGRPEDEKEDEFTALSGLAEGGDKLEHVYLNTGTWRKTHHRCTHSGGFMSWKDMTYVIIRRPDECPGSEVPVFDVWNGRRT